MTDTVGAITSAMQADAEALRLISLNIANAQVPAYRREIAVNHASFGDVESSLPALLPQTGTAIDSRAGTLQSTTAPLDLAIEGKGFFVVATEHGEAYTRRGDFRLDANGNIVTRAGQTVLGTNGPIHIADQAPVVAADGTVRAGDTVIDRLRVVDIDSDATLLANGDGTYTLGNGAQPAASSASTVRQGFLETSNVQTINETVQMMETVRRFEMAQRFMHSYDGMMDQAISTLGRI
jgi:flagellar basal-body rod protein FlgF